MNKDVLEEIIRVETLKKIRSIFEQMHVIRYSCHIDSLARIDDEECSCRGCIYGYSARCMSPMIMEEEVKVFR